MLVLDRFLPDPLTEDLHALRRGRLVVGTAFGLALAVAVGLGVRLAIAELHPAVVVIDLCCIPIFLAGPWLLRATGSLDVAGSAVVCGLFVLIVGQSPFVGGLDGPVLMATPLLPLVATYLLGARAGAVMIMLLLVVFALLTGLPRYGIDFVSSPLAGEQEVQARGLILSLTVALAGLFAGLSERQRIDTERRLRRSRELHRKTFEQSKDIVALSTPEGRLIDINQAGLDFYGYASKEEALKLSVEQAYVNLEQRRAMLEQLAADGYIQDYETEHRTASGEIRILQGTTSTIRGESGEVERLLAILRDVTERHRAEAEREKMLQALAAKNAELERFTYVVSHDLKAPLTTIRGFLGLLKQDVAAGRSERVESHYATLDRVAKKMAQMIDGLLELSNISSNAVSKTEVPLGDIVRDVVELLGGRIAETGTAVEIADDLPWVQGDPVLLRMIFQNLIDNAVKFSSGQARSRVKIDARREAGKVVCAVSDNGPGIAPRDQEKVFELFHQLNPEKGGTGIGLASVRRALEALGGRIWVESEGEGHGSTFRFTLPAGGSPEPAAS